MAALMNARVTRSLLFVSGLALCTTSSLVAQQAAPKLDGYPAVGQPAAITMLSTGTGEKRELRLKATVGQKEHIDISTKTTIAMEAMGMSLPAMNMPAMLMNGELTVTAVAPNGDITYDVAFGKMTLDSSGDVPPQLSAQLGPVLEAMGSIKGTTTLSNRGQVVKTSIDLKGLNEGPAAQATSQVGETLQNLTPGLPAEPVGVGAKWETRAASSANGMTAFTKSTMEITAMDATSVTIKSTIEQTAPAQAINNPAMPAGMDASLDSMTGKGTTTSRVLLGQLIPTTESAMNMTMAMKMNMGGNEQTMNMSMQIAGKSSGTPVK